MTFRRYAAQQIVATAGVLALAIAVVFLICHVAGPLQPRRSKDPQAAVRAARYAHESFGGFLWRLVGHGSLGHSVASGKSLSVWAVERAQVTLSLVACALVIALAIALPLGIAWDRRPRWARGPARAFVYLGLGLMPIVLGYWLSYYAGFRLSILPPAGYAEFFSPAADQPGGPVDWIKYLILPGLTVALPVAALYTRGVRGLAQDVRQTDEQAVAEGADRDAAAAGAWGLAARSVVRWILRDIGVLMGAAVFAEIVFGLPGAGYSLVRYGVNSGDTAVVESILVLATLTAATLHLAGNLIAGAVSEDWRLGSRA